MNQQGQHTALELFQTIAERLNSKLKTQIKTFFLPLLRGALFALASSQKIVRMETLENEDKEFYSTSCGFSFPSSTVCIVP